MELRQPEDMPELLRELGIKYDPDRLAQVLKNRPGKVRARAIQVTAGVGAFIARLLRVSTSPYPQTTAAICIFPRQQHITPSWVQVIFQWPHA